MKYLDKTIWNDNNYSKICYLLTDIIYENYLNNSLEGLEKCYKLQRYINKVRDNQSFSLKSWFKKLLFNYIIGDSKHD